MCFSEEVSWIASAVSVAGIVNALGRSIETDVLAYSLAIIASMQVFEAMLWRDPTNMDIARLAALVNHLQPVWFWVLSANSLPAKSPDAATRARVALAAYVAAIIPYTIDAMRRPHLVVVGPNGLEWKWHYGPYREVVYGLFLTSLVATAEAYFDWRISAVIVGTFIASWVQYRDSNMVGSMWCFYAAFLPWLLPFYT